MNKDELLDLINRKIKEISEEFDFELNTQENLIYVYLCYLILAHPIPSSPFSSHMTKHGFISSYLILF